MKHLPTPVYLLLFLAACTRVRVEPTPRNPSTRDGYEDQLLRSDVAKTQAYTEWSSAGRKALREPLAIRPSFKERLVFWANPASALAYRLNLRRGQRVTIDIEPHTKTRIFAEVFEEIGPGDPVFRLVHAARTFETRIVFEAHVDGPHVLRLQPELFRGGEVEVAVSTAASLTFPVLGKTSQSIQSFFGDPRDGGRRDHEGIDIFAKAGTTVVAAAPGVITNVSATAIGGNVVWQDDPVRGVSYYYAHLKSQSVRPGQHINAGDEIGTVGNTGNARTTPSHLHFAVYRPGRIAIDPVPFLFDQPGDPVPLIAKVREVGGYSVKGSR